MRLLLATVFVSLAQIDSVEASGRVPQALGKGLRAIRQVASNIENPFPPDEIIAVESRWKAAIDLAKRERKPMFGTTQLAQSKPWVPYHAAQAGMPKIVVN